MKFSTGDEIKFLAHIELGVNLIGGVDTLRAGSRTDSGLLTFEEIEEQDVFGNRVGYLGVDFGKGGEIHLGKDKGQHYTIAGWTTDRWFAFGGQASLAYPALGDGGNTGTGRADEVLNYRVSLGERVDLGVQTQFTNSGNDSFVDGFGTSLVVTVMDGLKFGAAYTEIEVEDLVADEILGADGDSKYGIVGLNYTSDVLDVGAVWSTQENGDLRKVAPPPVVGPEIAQVDDARVPVVFDGDGIEIYVHGKLDKWGLTGGYIDYDPDTEGLPGLDPNARIKYFIVGADWRLAEGAWVYTEFKIDDSIGFFGEPSTDVGVVGFKYQFSWEGSHNP